jgi:cold shock CspA family protein
MDTVVGKLKPRKADSPFGFLVPDDGSGDVYLRFADLGEKQFGELYGCTITVKVKHGDRGRVATALVHVEGEPTEIPKQSLISKLSDGIARKNRIPKTPPGQELTDWANITLRDHVAIFLGDDGKEVTREYKSVLPELHDMLLKGEEWDFESEKAEGRYRILENYLKYTFYRLVRENKIAYSKDKSMAIFDTGLVDNLFEPIYAVFVAHKEQRRRPYRFQGWARAGRGHLGKRILTPFPRLPDRAEYFTKIGDVILPRDIEVVEQWEHIIDDGIKRGRYPWRFVRKYIPDGFELPGPQLDESHEDRKAYLQQLTMALDAIIDGPNHLEFKHKIESCIKTALKRVEWNYKTAIPLYFPQRDRMSIALPLALFDSETADLALILEKKNERTYYASTVLTLDMAYLGARLVCRPLSDWLTTNTKIVGLADD